MSSTPTPKWYLPVAVSALIWNLLGCAAYLSDVMLSAEDIAAMSEAQQALYASRPTWAVAATATAVWGGAAGCLGLILRKSWALPVLVLSLAGIIVQDIGLFILTDAGSTAGGAAYVLQGLVFVVGVGLVVLGRKATQEGWVS